MTTTTATDTITRECGKCAGTGTIQAFARVLAGRCFDCGGAGTITTTAKREAARKAAAKRRAAKAAAAAQATVDARMRDAKAAGMSLREYHDGVCGCGDDCSRTWNVGAMGKDWDAA